MTIIDTLSAREPTVHFPHTDKTDAGWHGACTCGWKATERRSDTYGDTPDPRDATWAAAMGDARDHARAA